MRRIKEVHPAGQYRLDLVFDDGVRGTVDLARLVGKGVFASWLNPEVFQRVRVGGSGDLSWDNGVELCPDSLYLQITGKSPEDVFPNLGRRTTHA